MRAFVIKSTVRGYLSTIVSNALWIIGSFVAVQICWGLLASIFAPYNVTTWSEWQALSAFKRDVGDELWVGLLYGSVWLAYAIMGGVALGTLHLLVYKPLERNMLYRNEGGNWQKVVKETYGFPFGKKTQQAIFDRIVAIDIVQPSISRMVDAGTLILKVITFTNADTQSEIWTIPAVARPYTAKQTLEEALAEHEGLTVKIVQ